MTSKIEQIIEEIEDYIDSCKFQTFSNTKITVDKEKIDDLLRELRMKTPAEIKHYQKVINNKDAILNDARAKAEALINKASAHTSQLINEHEIMQQAYAQANEVVMLATQQAQDQVNEATIRVNHMQQAATRYMDERLANLENLVVQMMNMTAAHYESFINNMNGYIDIIRSNREELKPQLQQDEASQEITEGNESELSNQEGQS
ncbi:MAG: vacuolar family H+-ATPase subunit H [Lachnospiraceae bacterium]|nr:vacuolar family H+-ATPase subunit H [Lachnospiraceae bacterium]